MAEGSAYKAGAFIDKLKKDKGPLSLGIQLKTFFNTYIRQGTPIANTAKLANNFEVFFINRLKKEINSKSRDFLFMVSPNLPILPQTKNPATWWGTSN